MDVTQQDVDRAFRIANWYWRTRLGKRGNLSDIESASLEGLAKAARQADGRGGVEAFWSYATDRILGEIRDELRRFDHLTRHQRAAVEHRGDHFEADVADRSGKTLRIDASEPMPIDARIGEDGSTVADLIGSCDPELAAVDAVDAVRRAVRRLSARERFAVFAYDGHGYPNTLIARALGVTEGRVSQIRKSVLRSLRAELAPCLIDAA